MKLISCNIYNFGGISNFKYSFNEGVNVICEENGWGKSTFATFIKVMLYGFENEKARDVIKNERQHYKPWTGDSYGGELCVEAGGKKYCIKKTFGSKPDKDETEIIDIDTGLPVNDLSDGIGEGIFNINAESFMRTAFISQQDCSTKVTGNINAKLGNLADNTDDINNYEKVMDNLKKDINACSPTRSTGEIYKCNFNIATLEQAVKEKDATIKSMDELSAKRHELSEELAANIEEQAKLGQAMSAESEYQQGRARKEQYENLIKELSDREETLANIKRYFPNGVPSDEAIDRKVEELGELSQLAGQLDSIRLSREEGQDLDALKVYFDKRVPTDDEIKDKYEKVKKVSDLEEKIEERRMSKEDIKKYEEYSVKFEGGIPSPAEIEKVQECISNKADLSQIINLKETRLRMLCDREKEKHDAIIAGNKRRKSTCLMLGVLLIIGGIVGMFVIHFYMAAASVLGLVLIAFSFVKKSTGAENFEMGEILDTLDKEKQSYKDNDEIIERFMKKYPWDYVKSELAFSMHEMKVAADEYKKLKAIKERDDTAPLIVLLDMAGQEIKDFIKEFEEETEKISEKNFGAYLHRIENNKQELDRLVARENKTEEAESQYNALKKKMEAFILSNAIKSDDYGAALRILSERIAKYKAALDEKNDAITRKQEFEKENSDYESLLALNHKDEGATLASMDERRVKLDSDIAQIRKYIDDYTKQLDAKQELLDEISEKETLLEEMVARRDELVKSYNIKLKTAECLERAKITFSNKYANPIKEGFSKYYNLLSEDSADGYSIDANISVSKDIKGHLRSTDFFSKGQQDKVGICMRMGLVEAMFTGEKPFLVFDDPFTNLDDKALEKAMNLMKKISGEYQLVYFTCSEQRNPA